MINIFTVALIVCYTAAGAAPLLWDDCPSNGTTAFHYVYALWYSHILPCASFLISVARVAYAKVNSTSIPDNIGTEWPSFQNLWSNLGRKVTVPNRAKNFTREIPLREANILAWMVRRLPAQDDVLAALGAIGFLAIDVHHAYFCNMKQESPLVREDIQRATEELLDNIAARPGTFDETTVTSALRACVVVSIRRPMFSVHAQRFLLSLADEGVYGVQRLRSFIASSTVERSEPNDSTYPAARLAVIASEFCEPRYSESLTSELERYALKYPSNDEYRGNSSASTTDPRLKFLLAVDAFMSGFHADGMLVTAYGVAAQDIASDSALTLPGGLLGQLRFVATNEFCELDFSAADLKAITALFIRASSKGNFRSHSVAMINILYQFQRKALPAPSGAIPWLRATFDLPGTTSELVGALGNYRSLWHARCGSLLSLLPLEPGMNPVWNLETVDEAFISPWSRLFTVLPMIDTVELIAEVACAFTVQLLAIHRRGYPSRARTMLRDLIPHDQGARIIAQGIHSRYHLALHMKIIEPAWWEELCSSLLQAAPDATWSPCSDYEDALAFANAIASQDDCMNCANDEIEIPWGDIPQLPDSGRLKSDRPEYEASTVEASEFILQEPPRAPERFYAFVQRTKRLFWSPSGAGSTDGRIRRRSDELLESA